MQNIQFTQFLNYLRQIDKDFFFDFELVHNNDEYIIDYLNEEIGKQFSAIFKTGNDSLICFWHIKDSENKSPLVWLDSEGSPISVIANSLFELFSLLLVGPGIIPKILTQIESYQLYFTPGMEAPSEYSAEKINSEIDYVRNKFSDYQELESWCKSMDISPNQTPFATIENALKTNENLIEWLNDKGLEF